MSPLQYLRKAGEFSTHMAIASFGFGTIFLIAGKLFPQYDWVFIFGLMYLIVAVVLNAIVFIHLFYYFIIHKSEREYLAVKMLIMLANIPVIILYVYLLFFINQPF